MPRRTLNSSCQKNLRGKRKFSNGIRIIGLRIFPNDPRNSYGLEIRIDHCTVLVLESPRKPRITPKVRKALRGQSQPSLNREETNIPEKSETFKDLYHRILKNRGVAGPSSGYKLIQNQRFWIPELTCNIVAELPISENCKKLGVSIK